MSANNWRECPKCLREGVKEQEQAIADAKAQYGRVPADEYERLMQRARWVAHPENTEETLREDWKISTDKAGKFYVSYRCSCENCDFEFSFNHEQDALNPKERKDQSQ